MNIHHPSTRSSNTAFNEMIKKTPSPRRQTTRSTTHSSNNKDNLSSSNIKIIKPVAVRPPSSDSSQTPYNLRSRTKLKSSPASASTEVIPSFTEKLSLDTPTMTQSKPVPPLTRAAAASAGVKVDSILCDESIKTSNPKVSLTASQSSVSTRSSTTRKRKASEDDHRPYLDLLKMKQVIAFFPRWSTSFCQSEMIIYGRVSHKVLMCSSSLCEAAFCLPPLSTFLQLFIPFSSCSIYTRHQSISQ